MQSKLNVGNATFANNFGLVFDLLVSPKHLCIDFYLFFD